MRLRELTPILLRWIDDAHAEELDHERLGEADGVRFYCPLCTANGVRGVHQVLCWHPRVPQSTEPGPGRRAMEGANFDDLSLVAGSSSVLLKSGCRAHFFVRAGAIEFCADSMPATS